jgi:hypothetical protein
MFPARTISFVSLFFLSFLLRAPMAVGQFRTGGYAGAPTRREDLPQEAAMGGAFTTISPNASTIFANSAYLAHIHNLSVSFATAALPWGQGTSMAGIALGFDDVAGIGLGISSYGVDDAQGRTIFGQQTGPLSSRDLTISIGGGLALGPGGVGATIHYLRRDLSGAEGTENGYAVDLSGTLTLAERFQFAVGLNNVAGSMSAAYESGPRERIPWNTKLGFAYIHALEEPREEIIRPDPSGTRIVRRSLPETYVMGTVETKLTEFDAPVIGFAAESVPVQGLGLGLRLGANTLGDFAFGFFYTLPNSTIGHDVRFDGAARVDYLLGDISYHGMITIGL